MPSDDAPLTMRVLPFREYLSRGAGVPVVEVSGRIEGAQFILTLLGADVPVPTHQVGTDNSGRQFAIVEADHERTLPGGYRLRTEMEFDEDGMPPTGWLRIWLESKRMEAMRDQARREGRDSDRALLIVPPEQVFSIHFRHDGSVECAPGGSIVRAEDPARPN